MPREAAETLEEQVNELIRLETSCLNRLDLDAWIALFTEDGYYWMPLDPEQADPEAHDSLVYDNRALMEMRKFNLDNPLSPSMQHKVRSVRILSDLEIKEENAAVEITASASVIAVIHHQTQDYFAGAVTWRLVQTDKGLKIKSKRVDLLNADAPLDKIMIYV